MGEPLSSRNPLDNIPLPAIVEAGCARIGVACEPLHVFERDALLRQVRERNNAERMR
jgi:hypothetical protein